jgi:hypothetical protein
MAIFGIVQPEARAMTGMRLVKYDGTLRMKPVSSAASRMSLPLRIVQIAADGCRDNADAFICSYMLHHPSDRSRYVAENQAFPSFVESATMPPDGEATRVEQ